MSMVEQLEQAKKLERESARANCYAAIRSDDAAGALRHAGVAGIPTDELQRMAAAKDEGDALAPVAAKHEANKAKVAMFAPQVQKLEQQIADFVEPLKKKINALRSEWGLAERAESESRAAAFKLRGLLGSYPQIFDLAELPSAVRAIVAGEEREAADKARLSAASAKVIGLKKQIENLQHYCNRLSHGFRPYVEFWPSGVTVPEGPTQHQCAELAADGLARIGKLQQELATAEAAYEKLGGGRPT